MFKLLASGVIATILSLFSIAPAFADDTGIASMLHTLRGESGKLCMVGHVHHGESQRAFRSRSKALQAAIRHYVSFTILEYGSDWGSFRKAASRSSKCERASGSTWTCKVQARPCRKDLNMARR